MMNFIYSIPASIGWTMVGFVGALALVMGIILAKTFVQMWREFHEEIEE